MAGEIQIGGTTFATESGGTVTVANVDSATNRQNLGLEIGVDVQAFDTDTTKNDVANTFTANQIISVTDNTNAALRVTQLGTGNALVVEDSTNPDSTPFVVDASGNVGIGTSSSLSAKLEISGNNTGGTTTATALNRLRFTDTDTSSSGGPPNQPLGVIEFASADTSDPGVGARVSAVCTFGGSVATALTFETGTPSAIAERMQIDASGSLILAGSTAQKASGTTWTNPSDIRLKANITNYSKGISELNQIQVKQWEYNGKAGTVLGQIGLGVIADEIESVLPNTVDTYSAKLNEDDETETDIKKFDATEITWLLVNTCKEQQAIIDSQQSKILSLSERVKALEATP